MSAWGEAAVAANNRAKAERMERARAALSDCILPLIGDVTVAVVSVAVVEHPDGSRGLQVASLSRRQTDATALLGMLKKLLSGDAQAPDRAFDEMLPLRKHN